MRISNFITTATLLATGASNTQGARPTCNAYTDIWQNACTLERDRITDQALRHRILSGCEATTTNTYPDWCEVSPAQYYVDEAGQLAPSDSINEFIADSNSKSKPHGMMVGGATGSEQLKTFINNTSAHLELIDQIIETADSTQATSIDIDLEWPESTTECKNLLQFLITLKEQAGEHPIHFALHPFDKLGMYFNHEVEVDGKTFKTEVGNGNLKPVVFLYDLFNPYGNEVGLYRQTPQHCEYPKTNDGNGAYVSWDPNGDGSEDYDPNSRPFRGQINVDTVLEYLERNIPNFKDHAIISLPFYARAVDPNSPDRTNTYSIAELDGFSGETDECGETTFTDSLNPDWGIKAFPFDSMLELSRNLTANDYQNFTVWQGNLDTSNHDYLTELSDVWTLGKFFKELDTSGVRDYVETPHVFSDGATLWVSPYNAYFKDSDGNDIPGSFISGSGISRDELQIKIEEKINIFRSSLNDDRDDYISSDDEGDYVASDDEDDYVASDDEDDYVVSDDEDDYFASDDEDDYVHSDDGDDHVTGDDGSGNVNDKQENDSINEGTKRVYIVFGGIIGTSLLYNGYNFALDTYRRMQAKELHQLLMIQLIVILN